jgi:hypothetical protein
MRRFAYWPVVLILVLVGAPIRAEAPAKVVKDVWEAAYVQGAKCGFGHTVTTTFKRDGVDVYRTTLTLDFRIRRYESVVPMRMEMTNDETAEGKVLSMSLTQQTQAGPLTISGEVDGEELIVGIKGRGEPQRVKWDPKVIGVRKQELFFAERKVKPGDQYEFRSYEMSLLMPVTEKVVIKKPEETEVLSEKKAGEQIVAERLKKKLLRTETLPAKVSVGGNEIQLPRLVSWLDDNREPARSEMELPGLGTITLYRTTKSLAELPNAPAELMPDLGLNTLIPLNRAIANPHDAAQITYHVTVKGDEDPSTSFVSDDRQRASGVNGSEFTLTVQRESVPFAATETAAPKPEFSQSSHYIDSNDARVRELARQAVGRETDAWEKARRIERWVHDHMTGSSNVEFIPASRIAADLKGDCRQHAMLTAAMCRAAGIPSKTAIGLVYVRDGNGNPIFGFHMWTEVWARGKWLGVDATLGRGGVGPAHLKISEASWHDTQTLAPLLPVIRVMGKLAIAVTEVETR